MKISIGSPQTIWEIGKRDNQEDAIFPEWGKATDSERVFVLCDGMGGHEHGEVASQTVCATIYQYLHTHWPNDGEVTDGIIGDAILAAYDALDAKDNGEAKRMGTTLTLVVLHKGGCTAAHIGDSRIYHLRTEGRQLLYRSRDHSLVTDLYQAGEISYEEMKTSPQKNIITKAMQPGEDNRVRPDIVHIGNLRPDDYLYLCSDGMLEQMEDNQLLDIICSAESDEKKRRRLMEATAGNSDNHSAFLIRILQVERKSNESIVNDEDTSRGNFLNIRPAVVDAVEIETGHQKKTVETKSKKPAVSPAGSNRKWLWLIVVAVALLVIFALAILSGGKDDNKQSEKANPQTMQPIKHQQKKQNDPTTDTL